MNRVGPLVLGDYDSVSLLSVRKLQPKNNLIREVRRGRNKGKQSNKIK